MIVTVLERLSSEFDNYYHSKLSSLPDYTDCDLHVTLKRIFMYSTTVNVFRVVAYL